jgi:bla regulator protein BlaR1
MILNWMIASALFGGIVAVAAILAERALASAGRGRSTPWILALGVAVTWPLAAGLSYLLKPVEAPIAIIRTRIGSTAARIVADQIVATRGWGPAAETTLVVVWGAVTLLLLVRIAIAIYRMRVVTRAAERMTMDGTPVLVSDTAGPAVCGAVSPQIVLPRWILELDAPLREIVVRHEREHVARGDARTVLGAAIAVALVPWSPAVWVMYRRLRLAVELDCDARVLAAHDDALYSRLLMLVAQRQSHARLQPMLAESSAHLERRITEMQTTTTRSRVRAAALGTLSAGVVIIACSSPVMAGIVAPPPLPPKSLNEVLKLPVVRTTAAAPRENGAFVKLMPQGQGKTVAVPPPPPPKYNLAVTLSNESAHMAEQTGYPRYPDILKQAGVEGSVDVQFVVMDDGTIMEGSMKVLKSTHQLFTEAVRNALPSLRYVAATVKGKAVKQLIEQHFEFQIAALEVTGERVPVQPGSAVTVFRPNPVIIHGSVTVKKP